MDRLTRGGCFALIIAAVSVVAVLEAAAAEGPAYGPQTKGRRVAGEKLTAAVKIDTSKKPMPNNDTVLAIVAHSQEGDPNWADGGFSLAKAGDGQTVHVSGSHQHHVDAKLVGYGTTETGKTWIYEVKDLQVGGKKVFVAVSAEYSGDELRPVFISLGEDAPMDASSFRTAGWAVAGKKQP